MTILDDLAKWLAEETSMTVRHAVVLFSAEEKLPRFRLGKEGVSHHALMAGPAGLFFADLRLGANRDFFSALAEESIDVDDPVRLPPKTEVVIEGNWPSKKVSLDGKYYTVPRNFAEPLAELIAAHRRRR